MLTSSACFSQDLFDAFGTLLVGCTADVLLKECKETAETKMKLQMLKVDLYEEELIAANRKDIILKTGHT